MKALRIKLHQASANYRKEETAENKMTYPLPPISTITGALHSICGYREYHEMNVSIQGRFASMHREAYVDHCFLNSTMDDRGILVKMKSASMLSNAYTKVASAKKSQGNSFLKNITIQVHDEQLLNEYCQLRQEGNRIAEWKKTEYKNKLAEYKQKKSILALEKKEQEKGSEKFKQLAEEERKLKEEEKQYKINAERYEEEHYKKPIAKYRTLTKSLKYYEILDDIELVIHVQASDETLCDIYNHIDDLKALGRSEDFVDVEDIQFVNLEQDEESYRSCYSAYLNYEDVMNERINTGWYENRDISGTKYYLGKKYDVSTGKRIFTEKVKVIYTSDFTIDETSENVWVDKEAETEDGQVYIVNFL